MEVGILSEVFVNWTQTKRDEGSCDPGRNMADGQEMVISNYFFLFFFVSTVFFIACMLYPLKTEFS